jgi:hypothetical protein
VPATEAKPTEVDFKDPGLIDSFVTQFKLDPYVIDLEKPKVTLYTEDI